MHAEFNQYFYDHVFMTYKKSKGEVNYSSPNDAFFTSVAVDNHGKTDLRGGKEYHEEKANHAGKVTWAWTKSGIQAIDHKPKSYSLIPYDSWLFGKITFNLFFPFLPGVPDKDLFGNWGFKMVSETDEKVHLLATPKKSTTRDKITSCELILLKPEMTLYAIKRHQIGGNSATVYIFTNVKRNPPRLPSIDLSNYTENKPIGPE
ncbi:MAG: hypothetical protein JKY95_03965 [Planctomycetaceae bacterium]|nr:hypothetical protein [Planctomycetaceae bacterium]